MDRDPSTWSCVGSTGEQEFISQLEVCAEPHWYILPFSSVQGATQERTVGLSPASLVDTPDWVEGNSLSQPVTDSRLKKLQTGHPQLVMFVMSNLILPRTAGCAAP